MFAFDFLFKTFLILILIALSAFFSGSEAALFSLPAVKRKKLEASGTKAGEILAGFWKRPVQLLSTILIANDIANITATSLVTATIISILGNKWSGLSVCFMAVILLVFAEVTPKIVAVNQAEKWTKRCVYPLYIVSKIIFPLLFSLQWAAGKIIEFLKLPLSREASPYSDDELKTLLDISNTEGILESEEQEMIENILDFYSTTVTEIMTPRAEMFAFHIKKTISKVISQIKKTPHSRIPVYDKNLDHIKGIMYSKDLLLLKNSQHEDISLNQLIHPAFFVPKTQKVDSLLNAFQRKKVHMAVVVDEYGGTAGLITLEDLLEEIFGEITDEHDTEEKLIKPIKKNIYAVSGLINLEDFNKEFKMNPPLSGANSLGGFLLSAFGQVPKRGERFKHNDIEFIIRRSKATRITQVLVKFPLSHRKEENE